MSIIDDLKAKKAKADAILGFDSFEAEQGTDDWHKMRLGLITASNAVKILGKGATRQTYMNQLIAEICTGQREADFSNAATEWGNLNEPYARQNYEFLTDETVLQLGFLYGDDMRTGCSPDGITASGRGLEIKCPYTSKYHIDYLVNGAVKKEYQAQVQFSMWVTGIEQWDFCSFDPRMRRENLRRHTFERSDKWVADFDSAVPEFCREMDQKLAQIGFKFGEQWGIDESEQQQTAPPTDSAFG